MYLGLDVGGTHTDAVLCTADSVFATAKVKTMHEALPLSIEKALEVLLQNLQENSHYLKKIQRITLGTTLGLNALIQGKVAPVGLFLSAGPGINPLRFMENTPMAQYAHVVAGGLDHRGTEVTPLQLNSVQKTAKAWLKIGIKHFAIAGKFSPRNAAHENAIEQELLKIPNITAENITLSHSISGTLNFPRRMAAAYFNAAIQKIQRDFLDAVRASLTKFHLDAPIFMLQADGGALAWRKVYQYPLYSVLSGPSASVMGAMALCQKSKAHMTDAILLDIGGTTTDIALYAQGIPVLDKDGMRLQCKNISYKTSLRSLMTHSLNLGGDSLLGEKNNNGEAMAFGGAQPTFLDALNVCAQQTGHSGVGDVFASLNGLKSYAKNSNYSAEQTAQLVIEEACQNILGGIKTLLEQLAYEPVYTIEKLLEGYTLRPKKVYFVGAPAALFAPWLAPYLKKHLGVEVEVPPHFALANALGAALTLPTAQLEFFADTLQGYWHIPTLHTQGKLGKKFTLQEGISLATKALQETSTTHTANAQAVDVISAESFAVLDDYGRGGKDIRIVCQWRPGLVSP